MMATNSVEEVPVTVLLKRKLPPNSSADVQRQAKKSKRRKQGRSRTPGDSKNAKGVELCAPAKLNSHGSAIDRRTEQTEIAKPSSSWRISEPVGGRITEIDPIFSPKEDLLIVTFETALQVYTTQDSHLVRRIPLHTPEHSAPLGYIVATRLSPANPNIIWVVSSKGWVWMVDWTVGEGSIPKFRTMSGLAHDCAIISPPKLTEILIVSESNDSGCHSLVAYNGLGGSLEKGAPKKKIASFAGKSGPIRMVKITPGSMALAAILGDKRISVGTPTPLEPTSLANIAYTFYALDAPDYVTCLDTRSSRNGQTQHMDLVVGCARGAIFVYKNVLNSLRAIEGSTTGRSPFPIKHHWHRKAAHSVKWLQDGSHVASGSSDATLVTYQLERSKMDFLPHLGASISNITISPQGGSIALVLDDNSCIVLSTADIREPIAYISGIQTLPSSDRPPIDPVARVCSLGPHLQPRLVAAALHPNRSSHLLLAAGSRENGFSAGEETRSAPLVQAFDLEHFVNLNKQALARTFPTESNTASTGHPILTPEVTNLIFSNDGRWLASIDQWVPPERDHTLAYDVDLAVKQHRESHLRFWDVDIAADSRSGLSHPMPLVTRINAPHSKVYPRRVFDITADPRRTRFASLGDDCTVRMWSPRIRVSDGIVTQDVKGRPLEAWSCTKAIAIGEAHMLVDEEADGKLPVEPERNGTLVFSDDGSALFVALGTQYNTLVHIIDTETGETRSTLDNMFRGTIRGMKLMHKYLIALSDNLKVYDIVQDVLRYDLRLDFAKNTSLAVNSQSQTLALSYSRLTKAGHGIAVLSPREYSPVIEKNLPHAVISLLSAPGASGFVALDSASQVWSIEDSTEASSLRVLKSLAEIGIEGPLAGMQHSGDASDDESDGEGMVLDFAALVRTAEDAKMEDSNRIEDVDMYDGPGAAPISQDKLAEIFNQAPAWAMPSTSDIFYQVASLIGSKQKGGTS
ncbi:uncharacterized protein MKZ38_003886 [Zalerion maritima]|uniref:Uncharacterized protein n=1 Tax=Zalerion maritima TaxID=339359 RepID=A0AAD5RXI9_9PEZI|nr:uncharacterized protein MKZ38_003886 [Zalerion maritima]